MLGPSFLPKRGPRLPLGSHEVTGKASVEQNIVQKVLNAGMHGAPHSSWMNPQPAPLLTLDCLHGIRMGLPNHGPLHHWHHCILLVSCLRIHQQLLVWWWCYFTFPAGEINFKQLLWLIVLNSQNLIFHPLTLALFFSHIYEYEHTHTHTILLCVFFRLNCGYNFRERWLGAYIQRDDFWKLASLNFI